MEVAVLEGVPMVREAVLLHRPTGTVMSANLLLAMNQNTLVRLDIENSKQQGFNVCFILLGLSKKHIYSSMSLKS